LVNDPGISVKTLDFRSVRSTFSQHLYRARNLIDYFSQIMQCRRVVTRYDTARGQLSGLHQSSYQSTFGCVHMGPLPMPARLKALRFFESKAYCAATTAMLPAIASISAIASSGAAPPRLPR
jgi:hypothetical protein